MSQIQAIFSKGFAQIEKAKSIADEVGEEAEEAHDEIESVPEAPKPQQLKDKLMSKKASKKKDKPNSLVQVSSGQKSASSLYEAASSAARES